MSASTPRRWPISGNHVAYRWRFDDPVKSQAFKQQHVDPYVDDPDQQLSTVQADIAVPTGGVFGEAVLGRGVSAEKIDLSRFWNWKDSMIPILPTSINPLSAVTPTPQNLSAEPGRLDESSARLSPLQDLPAPSGFGALAQTMQAQIFRDMSGQGMLQALAEATTKAAASSEQGAAQLAPQRGQLRGRDPEFPAIDHIDIATSHGAGFQRGIVQVGIRFGDGKTRPHVDPAQTRALRSQ